MGIRGFLSALFRGSGAGRRRHPGDDLADELRDAMGPQAGGGEGGRMTGHAVYGQMENRERG